MKRFFTTLALTILIAHILYHLFGRTLMFSGSGNCAMFNNGDGTVFSQNSVDISPPTYWLSTMMANASIGSFKRVISADYPSRINLLDIEKFVLIYNQFPNKILQRSSFV